MTTTFPFLYFVGMMTLVALTRGASWFPNPGFDQYGIEERKAMVALKKSGIYDNSPFELFKGFSPTQIEELAKDVPDMNIIKSSPLEVTGWGVNPNSYFAIDRNVPMEPSLQKAVANFKSANLLTARGAENTQYMAFLRLQSEAVGHYEPIKLGLLSPSDPAKVAFQQFQTHENALFAGREAAYNKLNFKGIDAVLNNRATSLQDLLKADGQLAATSIVNPETGNMRDQVKGTIAEGFDAFLAKSPDEVKALALENPKSWDQLQKTFSKFKQFTPGSVENFIKKNGKKNSADSEKLILGLWEEIKVKMGTKASSVPSFSDVVDSVSREANLGLGTSEKSGLIATFAAKGSTMSAEEISHIEVAALQKNLANGVVCTPLIRRHFAKRSNVGTFCRMPTSKLPSLQAATEIGTNAAPVAKNGVDLVETAAKDTAAATTAESHPIASLLTKQSSAITDLSIAKTGAISTESSLAHVAGLSSGSAALTGLELGNEARVAATLASEDAGKLALFGSHAAEGATTFAEGLLKIRI